jgi:probable phosphoglycerate mutase
LTRPARICVARHGQTDWNKAQILQGWLDVPLNEVGRREAHEFAEALIHEKFSCVYTSPLRRALETAQIVVKQLALPPPIRHQGLKERNFGLIQGRPKDELRVTHPELLEDITRRNPAAEFEQGETMDAFAERVLGALEDIARTHGGENVLVITHGWVMDVVTRHISHLPRSAILNMKRKNTEYVWVDATPRTVVRSPHPHKHAHG